MAHVPQASTPPTRAPHTPPGIPHRPAQATRQPLAQEIEKWLESPGPLISLKFESTAAGDDGGEWYVEASTQTRAGTKFIIKFEDCPGPVPMDVESMRWLLSQSVVVL